MYSFVSSFLCSTLCLCDSLMLCVVVECLFLLSCVLHFAIPKYLFTHFTVDRHLSSFQFGANIKSVL